VAVLDTRDAAFVPYRISKDLGHTLRGLGRGGGGGGGPPPPRLASEGRSKEPVERTYASMDRRTVLQDREDWVRDAREGRPPPTKPVDPDAMKAYVYFTSRFPPAARGSPAGLTAIVTHSLGGGDLRGREGRGEPALFPASTRFGGPPPARCGGRKPSACPSDVEEIPHGGRLAEWIEGEARAAA